VGARAAAKAAAPMASLLETWVGDFLENIAILLFEWNAFLTCPSLIKSRANHDFYCYWRKIGLFTPSQHGSIFSFL
jgi:hypothetical protein